jgi:hypothetical protein
MATKSEKKHMSQVAQLGCVVCFRIHGPHEPGPVELHHPRSGVGMAMKSSNMDVIPLCVQHHRGNMGIHGMGRKAFEARYGFTEMELLEDVRQKIDA